jgi:hypothetical protein
MTQMRLQRALSVIALGLAKPAVAQDFWKHWGDGKAPEGPGAHGVVARE